MRVYRTTMNEVIFMVHYGGLDIEYRRYYYRTFRWDDMIYLVYPYLKYKQ